MAPPTLSLTTAELDSINRRWHAKRNDHRVRQSAKAQQARHARRREAHYSRFIPCPICRTDDFSVLHDRVAMHRRGWKEPLANLLITVLGEDRASAWASRLLRRQVRLAPLGYRVMQCTECGFAFRNPTYTEAGLERAYNSGNYSQFLSGDYAKSREDLYAYIYDEIELDRRTADFTRRRLLDFGCGFGLFMNFMRSRGWDPYGFDFSSDSIALGRERFGLENIRSGTLDENIFDGDFDLVSMISVVAHVPDPVNTFRQIHRILRPGGGLLIWTVNSGGFEHRLKGPRWNGFTLNHLVFFDQQSITTALKSAGFESVEFGYDRSTLENLDSSGAIDTSEREALATAFREQNLGNMLLVYATKGPDQNRHAYALGSS